MSAETAGLVEVACACDSLSHGHGDPCSASFAAHRRRGAQKTSALYCPACRSQRRADGQKSRWARARQERPGLSWRSCAYPGCTVQVPSYRRYHSRGHYFAAHHGLPRKRTGHPVRCSCMATWHSHAPAPCGRVVVAYWRPSRLERSRRHYCPACREDRPWTHRPPEQARSCQSCGRPRARGSRRYCRACYLAAPRGPYHRRYEVSKVTALRGRGLSLRAIAVRLGIAPATVLRATRPLEQFAPAHVDRVRTAKKALGRPAGLIAHGTPAGYNAHRRRGSEPCLACRTAWRADGRRRRAARQSDGGSVRQGRPPVTIPADIAARLLSERADGRTYAAIAAALDTDGIRAPGQARHWYGATVRTLILRARSRPG